MNSHRLTHTTPCFCALRLALGMLTALPGAALHEIAVAAPEVRVNTYLNGAQGYPAIAANAAGNMVIVWMSEGQDGDGYGVYAQRYDPSGTPQGGEIPINAYTAGNQSYPAVAMAPNGDFTVTWASEGQDGDGYGIYARRYDAAGQPRETEEFRINAITQGHQLSPAIAMNANGDFAIAWAGYVQRGDAWDWDILARRYGAAGAAKDTGEFPVNAVTVGDQVNPAIAMDAAGDFVVAWSSYVLHDDQWDWDIFARRYREDANAFQDAQEFTVNDQAAGDQEVPAVARHPADGSFVIAWTSDGQDGDGYGVYARRYGEDGSPQTGEFLVNGNAADDQDVFALAMDSAGQFVIAWTSFDQDGDGYGVFARRYGSNGSPVGGESPINTLVDGDQYAPAIAFSPLGETVAAWMGRNPDSEACDVVALLQDGCDVYASLQAPPQPKPLDAFLSYKTRPTKGSLCSRDAPKNPGGRCESEEACGGQEEDTAYCLPNKFPKAGLQVLLDDPFDDQPMPFIVTKPLSLLNPAKVGADGVTNNPDIHLRGYLIAPPKTKPAQPRHVPHRLRVMDPSGRFDPLLVDTVSPERLLAPSSKGLNEPVPVPANPDVDYFKCYKVKVNSKVCDADPRVRCKTNEDCAKAGATGSCNPGFLAKQLSLTDQFEQPKAFDIRGASRLCLPTDIANESVSDSASQPDNNLMCYKVKPARGAAKHVKHTGVYVNNPLWSEQVDTQSEEELCVPSLKEDLGPVQK